MFERRSGQAVVEFALVAPIFFALLFGVIAASWLFFQASAVNDAAQGGAREAIVETNFNTDGGGGLLCESNQPRSIEAATQQAANILNVDPNRLCNYRGGQTFTQHGGRGKATITVTVLGSLSSPTGFTVTVKYTAHPLEPLLGTQVNLKSTSTLSAQVPPN